MKKKKICPMRRIIREHNKRNLETDLVQEDPLLVEPLPRKTVERQLHLSYLVHDSTIDIRI